MRRVFDPSAGAFQRKWLTMAWRSVLCGAGMVLTAPVMALADSAPFSIATQPMPTALKSFAAQAHMQLLYQYNAVAKLMGNAVNGQLEKRVALELLLRNTGLEAVYSSDDSATIRPANALASPTPPSSQNPSADKATPISYAAPAEAPPPNPPQAAPSAHVRCSPCSSFLFPPDFAYQRRTGSAKEPVVKVGFSYLIPR